MKLQELLRDIAAKAAQVNELFDAADKRGGEATKDEISAIKKLNAEIEELNQRAEEAKGLDEIRDANAGRLRSLKQEPVNTVPMPGNRQDRGSVANLTHQSLADQVFNHPEMVSYLKSIMPIGGHISESTDVRTPKIVIGDSFLKSSKTLITGESSTSGGAMVVNDRKPLLDAFYQRPLTIRDLITIGETSSDTVEYVRLTSVTNNAAGVAEASATGDGSGAKPESGMAMAVVTESVKTIAHWVPATTRALADAPQIRTLIDTFLRYGLAEEVEDQVLNGAGGQNFTGIVNTANVQTQAWDTNILKTTRAARTKIRTIGRTTPTAWAIHPNDWQVIDLLQDNEARYYYGGPARMGSPVLWGLPVVESEAVTEGQLILGDWKYAVLWERLQTTISMSNSHSDFFIRNMLAILAELRASFGVIRPSAFILIDGTA